MSGADSFQDLVRQVRAGSADAARDLVRQYEPAIRRMVRFRLSDSRLTHIFESMDICQSVFASFFVRAGAGQYDLEQPENLIKLLTVMARKKLAAQARNQRRQRRDHRRARSAADNVAALVANQSTPAEHAAGAELLRKGWAMLSVEERQIADLRKDGLDWAVIADRLGGTAESLRKKLTRAMDRVVVELRLEDSSDD
jgi:RNA polymerase sigma-70 factor (ECF subfamily)